MHDIKVLEEEWIRYHRKKRVPLYIGLFLLILLTCLLLSALYNNPFLKDDAGKETPNIEQVTTTTVSKKDITKKGISNNDSQQLEDDIPTEAVVENIPVLEEEQSKLKEDTANKRKKLALNIIESSGLDAYKDVEERFFKSKDIDDSLFLAQSYYQKGMYKKAEYWALQTNKINTEIDESWIIFAKSKMKQGHKNEAIDILKEYIKRTGSEKAKQTLLSITAKQ